jgi:FkbM family methyltransferase
MRISTALSRLVRYLRGLGIFHGTRVFARVHFPGAVRSVKIPGYEAPVILRRSASDALVLEQIFVQQDYSCPFYTRSPKVIVDAGANVGYSSVYFAKRYPEARVLAIEPDSDNFELLRSNIATYPNIEAVQAALWPRSTNVGISNPHDDHWAFQVHERSEQPGKSVPVLTMLDVLEWAGGCIGLLKLDIEGAEKDLFQEGNLEWLKSVNSMVIETHDWLRSGCSMALYQAIAAWNYDQFLSGEHLFIVRHGVDEKSG